MGINIFGTFSGMHKLLGSVALTSIRRDKPQIMKIARRIPLRKIKGGFRTIDNLPETILVQRLLDIGKFMPELSNLMLRLWYEEKAELRNTVSAALTNSGYELHPLDFDSEGVNWKKLRDDDLLNHNNSTYFAPNQSLLDGYDPTEVTLMCILNGWFNEIDTHPVTEVEAIEEKIDETPGKPDYQNEVIQDLNAVKKEDESAGFVKKEVLKAGVAHGNLKFTSKFKSYKERRSQFLQRKEELKLQLSTLLEQIDLNNFEAYFGNNEEVLVELKESYDGLINELNGLINELSEILRLLDEKYRTGIRRIELPKNTIDTESLEIEVTNTRNHFLPIIISKLNEIKETIKEFEDEEVQLFGEYIVEIEKAVQELEIEKVDELLGTLNNLFETAGDIKSAMKISLLSAKYLQDRQGDVFKKILKKVSEDMDPSEFFAFVFMASKDPIAKKDLPGCIEDHSKLIYQSVESLIRIHGHEFMLSVLQDEDVMNTILEMDDGNSLILLLAVYASLKNHFEIARNALWIAGNDATEYKETSKLVNQILYEDELRFSQLTISEIEDLRSELDNQFQKESGKYKKLTSVSHKIAKDILNHEIFPALESIYERILNVKNHDQIDRITDSLKRDDYSRQIYDDKSRGYKRDSHSEEFIRKTCINKTEEIREQIIRVTELKKEEIGSSSLPDSQVLINELRELAKENTCLSGIAEMISEELSLDQTISEHTIPIPLAEIVIKTILCSRYYALHFPNICIKLISKEFENSELLTQALEGTVEEIDPLEASLKLLKASNFVSSEVLKKVYNLESLAIGEENDPLVKRIQELEEKLQKNESQISPEYWTYKRDKRFGLALKVIEQDHDKHLEHEKLSQSERNRIIDKVKNDSLELKKLFLENRHEYSEDLYLLVNQGLSICESISDKREDFRLDLANKIIGEIRYISKSNDSTESLTDLINEYNENTPKSLVVNAYQQLSLEEIRNYMSQNDFENLGLTLFQWNEIRDARKDDIENLIANWNFLRDKPTTYEKVWSRTDKSEIEMTLIELCKSLGRICSLYITNDKEKIGKDPFSEWRENKEVPFVFTTKIINPRCSSLDLVVNIFILSDPMLESKVHLNKIKDLVQEKQLNSNSFPLLLVLGDSEKLIRYNTNPVTKLFPVLNESILKKIIFASDSKKLPKWEFTSLLIQTKQISDVQPFKSEGSVNSEQNIFVGREKIIKEIISSPKDFAIYGGRQIGKTSLLNEIKRQLEEQKNFLTVVSSFQGFSNSISVAKSIILHLDILMPNDRRSEIADLDDFKLRLKEMFLRNQEQRVAILLDEVDEMIIKEKDLPNHRLIEIFRDISHETDHKWIFIFAGFKEMYKEIMGKSETYEGRRTPWVNFVDSTAKNLGGIDNPEALVREGLKNILGLEYEPEVSKRIVNYSSGHPAFLQYFCQNLVEEVKDRISASNRIINVEDVDAVYNRKDGFISFVKRTLEMNLSDFQRLLVLIAADEKTNEFDCSFFESKLKDWLEVCELNANVVPNKLELELELLCITGVIRKVDSTKYRFTHERYLNILKRIEQVDREMIGNLVIKLFQEK